MASRGAKPDIRIKRAYEAPAGDDGARVLIDRMWPRGVSKADAALDLWLKDIAPSAELRTWFGHEPTRFAEFRERYAAEIHAHPESLQVLRRLAREGRLTLVYSARDREHNDAVVLREILRG
jgi:uncharacterized protein YeaO (DUF488 family)